MAASGERPDHGSALRARLLAAHAELCRGLTVGPSEHERAAALGALHFVLMRVVVLAHARARGMVEAAASPAALRDELAARRRDGAHLHETREAWPRLLAAIRALDGERGRSLFEARSRRGFDPAPSDAVLLATLDQLLADPATPWAELEVESVVGGYEALVGLDLRIARGATMLLVPHHQGIDLQALLAAPGDARLEMLASVLGAPIGARLGAAIVGASSVEQLARALAKRASPRCAGLIDAGQAYAEPGEARRRSGAHYTPRALTEPLVARTLAPLLDRAGDDADAILALRVCDPAMGSGALLVEACRQIADRLRAADPSLDVGEARRLVAERCLHGVDADPLAVDLARAALWLIAGDQALPARFADENLHVGDALVGKGGEGGPSRVAADALCRARDTQPFHWPDAFPEVLRDRRGFDAVIGNPPWVAYAGRAAQPLADALFDFYRAHYPPFFGYRTLHGIFAYRAASLLAPGGRLGLVVPTSISDLDGYEPTRRAHDALCEVDAELPDFGDAFDGVFQPSMGLLSTRRASPTTTTGKARAWRVARDDVDPRSAALLERLSLLTPLPPECFGERGLQTTGEDVKRLRVTRDAEPPFVVPIREGGDVRAFAALPPRLHLDPVGLNAKLRPADEWRAVSVLVRQTARFPIAARADGLPFRNSLLACFGGDPYDADVLVAYLNASPIRWLHFMRHRDARQGMPQVKIAHLRAVPRIPGDAPEHLDALRAIGASLGRENRGITPAEQGALDEVAARALSLDEDEHALVTSWAAQHPAP